MKKIKIVATIGPKTSSVNFIKKLGNAGVDIFRLNGSHNTLNWHLDTIKRIKKCFVNKPILFDVPGRKVRTKNINSDIKIVKNKIYNISNFADDINITNQIFFNLIKKNQIIYADDGTLFVIPFDTFPGILSEKIINYAHRFKESYWLDKTKYVFETDNTNIGLHIRRGDISKEGNSNRWLELNDYLKLMDTLRDKKYPNPVKFHIFSEGAVDTFKELEGSDVVFHLDGSDIETFRMLSSIDILVTGLSTFSILAAYLSDGQIYFNKLMNFTRWDNIDNFTNVDYI